MKLVSVGLHACRAHCRGLLPIHTRWVLSDIIAIKFMSVNVGRESGSASASASGTSWDVRSERGIDTSW